MSFRYPQETGRRLPSIARLCRTSPRNQHIIIGSGNPRNTTATGYSQEEGTISEWYVAPGEKVEHGDVFCDVETDKSVVGFECFNDCIVADILAPEAMELPTGTPMMITVETEEELVAYQVRTLAFLRAFALGPEQHFEMAQVALVN